MQIPQTQTHAAAAGTHSAAAHTTEQRLDALELFLQHLVLVIECEPDFRAEHLDRWLHIARSRMQATGSTPAAVAALQTLQRKVLL
jgi:hypothetical protein